MTNRFPWWIGLTMFLIGSPVALSQKNDEANYDEGAVKPYQLPDPLIASDGTRIETAKEWTDRRRPELLKMFADHVYGHTPATPSDLRISYTINHIDAQALGGKAIRKQITIGLRRGERRHEIALLIYLPKITRPVPAFVGLNFNGNHAVIPTPGSP